MRSLLRNDDGQALIITLLTLTILLGFVGLATDVGTLFYTKRQLQTAADSAAIAGASEVTFTDWAASARADATKNGATNGVNGVTVTVNNPPLSGPHVTGTANALNYVEVIISQTQKSLFMSLFSPNPVTVAARAVGYLKNNPGCFFTLNTNGMNSFYLNGALLFLTASQCAMYVNSSNVTALNASGFFNRIQAKSIGIVGNWNHGVFTSVTPNPVIGIVPVSDPLAYLNPPSTGGCLPSRTNVGSAANPIANGTTLTPGNYCGSFTAGVANPAIRLNNATGITFAPGTYMINGGGPTNAAALASGGLSVTGFGGLTGNGVTLYLYNGASININTTVSFAPFGIKLTAPLPGAPFAGILIYQDRADISPATVGGTVTFMDLEGALYLPSAKLTFPSFIAGTISNFGIYVAKDIEMQGILGFLTDYATAPGTGGTSPIKAVALVE